MNAEQGQQYRIVKPEAGTTRIGQPSADRFVHRFVGEDGTELIVEDLMGDVIYASENVDYPRGANEQYRHVDWIDQHPQRFELIEES